MVVDSVTTGEKRLTLLLHRIYFEHWTITGPGVNPLFWFVPLAKRIELATLWAAAKVRDFDRDRMDEEAMNTLARALFKEALASVQD